MQHIWDAVAVVWNEMKDLFGHERRDVFEYVESWWLHAGNVIIK